MYRDLYEYNFSDLIDKALSFSLKSKREHIHRLINFKGEDIWVRPGTPEEKIIKNKQSKFKFVLHFWKPLGSEAEYAFKQIKKSTHYQEVYFAYKYDENKNFHVNNWNEIEM